LGLWLLTMKKQKKDPKEHELNYIEFLESQLSWQKKQSIPDKVEIEKLKYKLSKAKLVLKSFK